MLSTAFDRMPPAVASLRVIAAMIFGTAGGTQRS